MAEGSGRGGAAKCCRLGCGQGMPPYIRRRVRAPKALLCGLVKLGAGFVDRRSRRTHRVTAKQTTSAPPSHPSANSIIPAPQRQL